ncbi:MAG: hypothetical protein J6X81_02010 [Muribaculaceae bacterium]|nr:hypothetical protein [Muribaculaceae bacterium]
MKENTQEYRKERNREFYEIYHKTFKEFLDAGTAHPRVRAVSFAVEHGNPHYHVSLERALHVVPRILKGDKSILKRKSLQEQMWLEIAQKVRALLKEDGMGLKQAICFVITHCRASRFFITADYARHIVGAHKQKVRALFNF